MNLGLDEREIKILLRALTALASPPAYADSILRSLLKEEDDDDRRIREELTQTINDLPKYEAEEAAFCTRIDRLPELAIDSDPEDKSLIADLDNWKLPRHLSHEAVRLRAMVHFLVVTEEGDAQDVQETTGTPEAAVPTTVHSGAGPGAGAVAGRPEETPVKHPEPLDEAIRRLGLDPVRFPTTLETGGYSDDCHGFGGAGPGFDRAAFDAAAGGEYDEKAVRIDLRDGRAIVLITTFGGYVGCPSNEWTTYLAVPERCVVTGMTLHEREE